MSVLVAQYCWLQAFIIHLYSSTHNMLKTLNKPHIQENKNDTTLITSDYLYII